MSYVCKVPHLAPVCLEERAEVLRKIRCAQDSVACETWAAESAGGSSSSTASPFGGGWTLSKDSMRPSSSRAPDGSRSFVLQEALPLPPPRHLRPARHLSANDRYVAMRTPSKVRCLNRLGTLWRRLGKMLSAVDALVQTCLGLGRSFCKLDGLTIRGWLGSQIQWLLVSSWVQTGQMAELMADALV